MKTKVVRKILSNIKAIIRCIGCGEELSSGFHYTGSMIEGLQFSTIKTGEQTLYSYDQGSCRILEETDHIERKVAYYRRKKGPLCDSCSSLCRKTITDRGGNKHQVVIVDPRQGFIGETLACEGQAKPSYRGFNTTITR